VAGPDAAGYGFTSALPTQLLKSLGPQLQPLLERAPAPPAPAPQVVDDVDETVPPRPNAPCYRTRENRWNCTLATVPQSASASRGANDMATR
jgi:hypothetical protein